jgi:hypothetical protein
MSTQTKETMTEAELVEFSYRTTTPRIVRGRENWSLVVEKCPVCKGRTAHGGGPVTEKPYGGWRMAHCCGYQIFLMVEEEQ